MDRARNIIKRLLYDSGALSLYHRVRNRRVLTVAMFHRVLAPADPRWSSALSEWSLSESVFEACLAFFKRHYSVVGLNDVLASLRAERPLPPRSLLLTFDDGYADNAEYAMPMLRRHGLPAVVFVFSDAVGRKMRPWTEDFLQAYLGGGITADEVRSVHEFLGAAPEAPGDTPARVWDIVRSGPQLRDDEVLRALSVLRGPLKRPSDPAQMLSVEQMKALPRHGVAIGAHGKTHTAFPDAADLASELREPRRVFETVLGTKEPVAALSFPHGAHTPEIVDRTLQEGYQLAFTIREELTPAARGRLDSRVIGRVNVSGPAFAPGGRFRPELLAFYLFRRPHAAITALPH